MFLFPIYPFFSRSSKIHLLNYVPCHVYVSCNACMSIIHCYELLLPSYHFLGKCSTAFHATDDTIYSHILVCFCRRSDEKHQWSSDGKLILVPFGIVCSVLCDVAVFNVQLMQNEMCQNRPQKQKPIYLTSTYGISLLTCPQSQRILEM